MKKSLELLDVLILVETNEDLKAKAESTQYPEQLLEGESAMLFHLKRLRELIIIESDEIKLFLDSVERDEYEEFIANRPK
jgi:hypothetical protein